MVDTTLFPSMVHHSQNVKHVGAPSVVHVLLLVYSDKNKCKTSVALCLRSEVWTLLLEPLTDQLCVQ